MKNRINVEREGAKSGQKQQAQKMVSLSPTQRLPAVDIGTNVVVRVPDLDRGRLAPRNVLAVVVDVNSSGLYLLGTQEDPLERLYACNAFTTADNNFIQAHDVPSSSLYLRSASVITSGSKQGFVSCHCKRYCIDKKCKCLWKNMKSNSKYRCVRLTTLPPSCAVVLKAVRLKLLKPSGPVQACKGIAVTFYYVNPKVRHFIVSLLNHTFAVTARCLHFRAAIRRIVKKACN